MGALAIVGMGNIGVGLFVIALCIPLIRGRVPPNRLYGVRFKKVMQSEEMWYAVNRYGGKRMVIWSVVLAVIGVVSLFVPVKDSVPLIFLFASAPLLLGIPALETWRYTRRL